MEGREPGGIDELTRFLGLRWLAPNRVAIEIGPKHMNPAGLISGTVAYALVDYCMGSALWVERNPGERIATINISINYVQTAREGQVVCESWLDRRNDRIAVLHSEVRDAGDRLLANAVGSFSIFPKERLGEHDRHGRS